MFDDKKHVLSKLISNIFFVLVLFFTKSVFAQASGNCSPNTPFYNVNLSSSPNGTWTSSPQPRLGNCCGTTAPDKCVEFKITLSPQAVAINFQIASGAVPPGALFYQINCGPPQMVGTPLCLNGPGPYSLTFCKPGNNINSYAITSIAAPQVSPDDTVADGCTATMFASGLLVDASINWRSIYPGPQGAYNSYLNCTVGCNSVVVAAQPGAPPYVDYVVCGTPVAGPCVPAGPFCDTIRIHFAPPIINTINPNPAQFCANNPVGVALSGNILGGIPPYSYAWLNSAGNVVSTALTYTATSAGNYSFTVFDKTYPTCPPKTTTVTVNITPNPVINAGPDQTLCGTSVVLNGTVSGASGGVWSGGNGSYSPNNTSPNAIYTPSPSELLAGTIILTFNSTGNGACTSVSDQVIIKIAPPISLSITSPSLLCNGQTANITSVVSGGFSPYTFNWSSGQTTSSIYNISAGTYTLNVSSSQGIACSTTTVITINPNPPIIVNTSPNNSISCGTFATISATATGGTGSLTYLWSNGSSASSTNVYSGVYIITVTDAVGCTATNSVSVLASNSALVTSINSPTLLCNGQTTTLNIFATGGFGGYSYSWNNGVNTNSITVGPGNYCATVIDGGGCISSSCISIAQSPPINIIIPPPPTICNGAVTTLNSFVAGGQAPYSYSWSNGQVTPTITVPSGNYVLSVTDINGCSANSAIINVTQSSPLNAVTNSTNTNCFGSSDGRANVILSGGTIPYYYSWAPYGGASANAIGLLAGTYTTTVTDALGCNISVAVVVNQPTPVTANISVNNNVSCYGGSNGNANVLPSGGTPGYTFLWNPGGSNLQNPTNLNAGNYLVSITDSKGCSFTTQTAISQPSSPLSSSILSQSNTACYGGSNGSAIITGSGGTPGYSYQWLPTGNITASATNLSAGTYSINVTDANFCTTQQLVTIGQPTQLTSTTSVLTNVSCFGGANGSTIVNGFGGTPPYSYQWNTSPNQTTQVATNLVAGSYIGTITDSKNCVVSSAAISITQPSTPLTVVANPPSAISCSTSVLITASAIGGTAPYTYSWSNGVSGAIINVFSGTYSVTATDNFGCTAVTSASVLSASNSLTASITQPANICYGGSTSVSVTASGGFGGYTYLWDDGSILSSVTSSASTRCVNVTDAVGCIVSACVNIIQNTQITPSILAPPYICPLSTTTLYASVTGGQAPYSYLWSNGVLTSSIIAGSGTYTVTVFDSNGSTCFKTATVSVNEEPPLTIYTGSTNVSCYGGNNGTASIYVNGGIPGYNYLWSVSNATNSIVGGLSAGSYSVLVTDNIGCKRSANVLISQPSSSLNVVTSATNITCYQSSNGSALSTAIGGIGTPYYYYWEPLGASTYSVTNLVAGTYSIVVADSSGCFTSKSVTITEPPMITALINTVTATCGYSNGSSTITPSGGGGVYNYTWSPTNTNSSVISNATSGIYTVDVKDNLGCIKQFLVDIPQILSTASPGFSVSTACPGTPSFFTDLSVTGNDFITYWSWDFGDPLSGSANFSLLQNPNHVYTTGGNYTSTLTIHTGIGCIMNYTLSANLYPNPNPNFLLNPVCANSSISFTNTSTISSGSITNYDWNFNNPSSTSTNTSSVLNPVHYYSIPGTYNPTLTTTSNNGCTSSVTHSMEVYPVPNAAFATSNSCLNTPINFTNQSSGSFVKWYWNFGDGSPIDSVLFSPTHTYTNSGVQNVSLLLMSNHSCSSTNTATLTVHQIPIANFTAPNVCEGRSTNFNDISAIATGSSTSWSWDFGDFSTSTLQNPTHIFGVPGIFYVNFTVNTSVGCSSSITKTVSVLSTPTASFSYANACLNASTQFTDLSNSGMGATIQSWQWGFGDGSPVNTSRNPIHTYPSASSFNTILVVTNNNGCKDTITKNFTIQNYPIVSFAVSDTAGCAVFCPDFIDTSTPSGLITSWEWNFGDGSSTNNSQNPTHCFNQSGGNFSVTLTAYTSNGCVGQSNQNTVVSLYPNPIASFNYTPSQPASSSPEVYLTNTSTHAVSWDWDFGDGISIKNQSSNNDVTHSYENAGDYCIHLKAYNAFGCSDIARQCFYIEPDFTFYIPNAFTPSSTKGVNDFFTGKGINISKFEMWIFDRWGEMIYYTDDIQKGWDGKAKKGSNTSKQDVYTYKINVYDFRGDLHKYIGHVTLLE